MNVNDMNDYQQEKIREFGRQQLQNDLARQKPGILSWIFESLGGLILGLTLKLIVLIFLEAPIYLLKAIFKRS